jgi:hypothetical protein
MAQFPTGTSAPLSLIELGQTLDPIVQMDYQKILTGAFDSQEFWVTAFCTSYSGSQQVMQFPYNDQFFETFLTDDLQAPARFRGVAAKYQTVKVKKIQPVAIQIHETEIGDQRFIGQVLQPQIAEMAKTWIRTQQGRAINALINGDSDPYYKTAYDDEQFFSPSHKVGIAQLTWSNLFPYSLSAANYAKVISNYRRVPLGDPNQANHMLYLPTGGAEFILVVPPELEELANLIFTNDYLYQSVTSGVNAISDNPFKKGTYAQYAPKRIIAEPNLSDEQAWYVLMKLNNGSNFWVNVIQDTGSSRQLIASTASTDESVKNNGMLQWQARSFEETYPTLPFLQTKCSGMISS